MLYTCLFILLLCPEAVVALNLFNKDVCGTTKSCIKPNPDDKYLLAYTYYKDLPTPVMEFEYQGRASGPGPQYIALGFSKDTDTAVTACVYSPTSNPPVAVILTYNVSPQKNNRRISDSYPVERQMLSVKEAGLQDGYIICRFNQTAQSSVPDVFTLSNQPFTLLFARGPASSESLSLAKHLEEPYVSGTVTLSDAVAGKAAVVVNSTASTSYLTSYQKIVLKKTHGILMIFGWWLFVPMAIFFARYFRSIWPNTKPCKLALWFHFHRGFNGIGYVLVIAAFICILVAYEGRWNGEEGGTVRVHCVTGLTAVIGMLVQPVMAVLRCSPGHRIRPLFNWPHRIVGIGSFGCACTAIWFVTYWEKWGLHTVAFGDAPRGLMIFYFVIVCATALVLEIHLWATETIPNLLKPKIDPDIRMQGMNPSNQFGTTVIKPDSNYRGWWAVFRSVFLTIFALSAIGVTVALTSFIGVKGGVTITSS